MWAGRRGPCAPLGGWGSFPENTARRGVWAPGGGAQLSAWARTCEYPEGSSPKVRGSGSCQTWAIGACGYRGKAVCRSVTGEEEMVF